MNITEQLGPFPLPSSPAVRWCSQRHSQQKRCSTAHPSKVRSMGGTHGGLAIMQITLQTATIIRFLQEQIAATAFGCIEGRTFSEGFFDNVQLKSITEALYDHGMLFFTCKADTVC